MQTFMSGGRLESSGLLEQYPTLSAYIARGVPRPAYRRAFEAQHCVCALETYSAVSPESLITFSQRAISAWT